MIPYNKFPLDFSKGIFYFSSFLPLAYPKVEERQKYAEIWRKGGESAIIKIVVFTS